VAINSLMRERFENPKITAEELILKVETPGMSETANFLAAYKDLL
jgi:hypothetical protein